MTDKKTERCIDEMADIELVIKIPEEKYNMIRNKMYCGIYEVDKAITNGTPLPKGHGRLVDSDRLEQVQNERLQNGEIKIWEFRLIESALNAAETVVEADEGAELTRKDMYMLGCLFAVNRLIENGSSSFGIKVNGKWETVPWEEIKEWIEKQYAIEKVGAE